MSIKRLSFPIFIVVAIFLGVFLVKPAVSSVLEKRQIMSEKETELSVVQSTKQNVEALATSRETLLNTDEGKMVYSYLPVSVNQDRIVDTFNYYAMLSGAVVDDMTFEMKHANQSPYFAAELPKANDVLSVPVAPEPDSFTLHANIQGSYQSIKAFMKEVSHPARSYRLVSFSIEKKDAGVGANGEPARDSGILTGSFAAEFYYFSENKYPQGYLLPVFTAGQFDLSTVTDLIAKEKNIPALSDPSVVGRENPFAL
jgi:Tfp pilus assembly protein PilO